MGQYQTNLLASAAQTKDGSSSDHSVNGLTDARFLLSVTEATGTSPTLDIVIEAKTKSGKYVTIASFDRVTSPISQTVDIWRMVENFRITWKAGGVNPSFTFEIDAIYNVNI